MTATENLDMDADTPFVPDDDRYHPVPDDDPFWTETTWWSFNVPERRLGGWLHAARQPVKNAVTWRVFVWDDFSLAAPGQLAYHRVRSDVPMDPDSDLRDITFPGGGFSVRMVNPLTDYQISYTDRDAGFAIDLDFHGVHAPRRFTPGEPPMMWTPHLDQLGHIEGELILRGQSIPIDCYSVRDRTWGPRGGPSPNSGKRDSGGSSDKVRHPGGPRWREIERERGQGRIQYIFGHSGPQTGFLGFVRPQDGNAAGESPLNHGWLLKDGRFEHLDKTASTMKNFRDPRTGWSSHMVVSLTDVAGRSMSAEGFTVSNITETGVGGTALMRWEFDGEIGWGEDQDIWRPKHFAQMLRALRQV